jgi:hypothetical protein
MSVAAGAEGAFEGLKSSLSGGWRSRNHRPYRERVRSGGACRHPCPDACSVAHVPLPAAGLVWPRA